MRHCRGSKTLCRQQIKHDRLNLVQQRVFKQKGGKRSSCEATVSHEVSVAIECRWLRMASADKGTCFVCPPFKSGSGSPSFCGRGGLRVMHKEGGVNKNDFSRFYSLQKNKHV